MSRLDLAKMVVEDISKRLRKTIAEHNNQATNLANSAESAAACSRRTIQNMGQGPIRHDSLLLLATTRQHPDTANVSTAIFSVNMCIDFLSQLFHFLAFHLIVCGKWKVAGWVWRRLSIGGGRSRCSGQHGQWIRIFWWGKWRA